MAPSQPATHRPQRKLITPSVPPSNIQGDAIFPKRWTVIGPVDVNTPMPPREALAAVPTDVKVGHRVLKPWTVTPTRNQFVFASVINKCHTNVLYAYAPFDTEEAGPVTLGMSGDYRFRAWLNGEALLNGEEVEDTTYPPGITNTIVTATARKGRNCLTLRLVMGLGGAAMAVGGPRELRAGDFRSVFSDAYFSDPRWSRPRPAPRGEKDAVHIGDRRELFVDTFLIDRLSNGTERRLHHPVHREVVLTMDRPWEGNVKSNFLPTTIMEVDGKIRLYYKGIEMRGGVPPHEHHLGSPRIKTELICLAESDDGIHFTRPNLGRFSFGGSRRNNIVLRRGRSAHNFAPFVDEKPGVPPSERFKALSHCPVEQKGLTVQTSPDGIRWKVVSREPLITEGMFDSQNVAFWDAHRGRYVEYHRGQKLNEPRGIMTSVSDDMRHWTAPRPIRYEDDRREQMYINCIRPYPRAPHILLGTPARLVPPRVKVYTHPNPGVSDAVLICSRDGTRFYRWSEAFLRPGLEDEVWTDRNNYLSWGMAQTSPAELSLYWVEHNGHALPRMRRGTLRVDGFVSIHAGGERIGELLTRPLIFSGDRLEVNYATSANGTLLFELCDEAGKALPGFTFADSETVFGNEVAHTVIWRGTSPGVGQLAGRPVRLRVRLIDADLYAIRFPVTNRATGHE